MKLQRNNKYKNKIALGFSTLMLASMLTGCAKDIKLHIPEETQEVIEITEQVEAPEVVPIVTPKPTPIVTPEPTPEPTPEVTEEERELTEEEKFDLRLEQLGITNLEREINLDFLHCIVCYKDEQCTLFFVEEEWIDDYTVQFKEIFYGNLIYTVDSKAYLAALNKTYMSDDGIIFKDLNPDEEILNLMKLDDAKDIVLYYTIFGCCLNPLLMDGVISIDTIDHVMFNSIGCHEGEVIPTKQINAPLKTWINIYFNLVPEDYMPDIYKSPNNIELNNHFTDLCQ